MQINPMGEKERRKERRRGRSGKRREGKKGKRKEMINGRKNGRKVKERVKIFSSIKRLT